MTAPLHPPSRGSRPAHHARGVIAALLLVTPSLAAPPAELDTTARTADSPAAARPLVEIAVIGDAIPLSELTAALGEGLASEFSLRFVARPRFDRGEPFRAPRADGVDVHVWLDGSDPRSIRLVFADRTGSRFLARTLEMSGTWSELDREALAQALEWSLRALAAADGGVLSRDELATLLGTPTDLDAARGEPVPAPPARGATPRSATRPALALFYRASAHSPEQPLVHGPGVRGAVDRSSARWEAGATAGAQLELPATAEDPRVALGWWTLGWRVEARLVATPAATPASVGVALGAGGDVTWVAADARDPTYAATGRRVSHTPVVGGGPLGRFDLSATSRLELGFRVEVDPGRVHYDLATATGTETLLRRHRARPSLALGIEWR